MSEGDLRQDGNVAGKIWATESNDDHGLLALRLETESVTPDGDSRTDWIFRPEKQPRGRTPATALAFIILGLPSDNALRGNENDDVEQLSEFWRRWGGADWRTRISDEQFLRGFIEGAIFISNEYSG
jgi:hypothetical protein